MAIDSDEFECLIEQYYKDVYQFSLYYCNDIDLAEDITQEAVIKAMKGIHSLKDKKQFKTWIFSIAKNTAIDFKRKENVIHKIKNLFSFETSGDKQVEDEILFRSDWEGLQDALLLLKPHDRTIIILRALKEMSIKETSEILNCKESKVRVDYHRAVQKLKSIHEKRGVQLEKAARR